MILVHNKIWSNHNIQELTRMLSTVLGQLVCVATAIDCTYVFLDLPKNTLGKKCRKKMSDPP